MENEGKPHIYLRQLFSIVLASGAIFSVGLNIAWPSPCLFPIMDELDISNRTGSYITTASPFGNVLGSGFSLFLLQVIGSKDAIFLSILSQSFFWFILAFFPPPWWTYSLGRIGTGFGESICNIALPSYIAEISCPEMKEKFLCLIPVFLIFGNSFVNAIGLSFDVKVTTYTCMTVVMIWSCINIIDIRRPRTPYYFIKKNQIEKALQSLKFYHGKEQVERVFNFIVEKIEKQKLEPNSMVHLFTIQGNRHAMFIMVFLKMSQLLSGYPATIIYTHQIFIRAKVNINENIAVGIYILLHLIFTIYGIFLNLTRKRKKFLMISFIGAFVFQFFVAIYFFLDELAEIDVGDYRWAALLAVCGYICFYSIGMHVVPNLLFFDLFSDSIKSKASCLMNMLQGAIFLTISKVFQEVTDRWGQGTMFTSYTIAAFFGIFFVHFCVPETQGKTYDEIHLMLEENEFNYILSSPYRY